MTVNLLVVVDVPLLQAGLLTSLAQIPDSVVCAVAATCAEALALARQHAPDLAIVDLAVDAGTGLGLLRRFQTDHSRLRVLACCLHDERLFAERALRAGARGIVGRTTDAEQLRLAVQRVLAGRLYLGEGIAEQMLERLAGGEKGSGLHRLTNRELEVFGLLGQGLTNAAIAEHLHLSVKTVECHRDKIKRKLGLAGAPELIRYALQWRLQAG